MKRPFYLLLAALFLFSCANEKESTQQAASLSETSEETTDKPPAPFESESDFRLQAISYFVGDFDALKYDEHKAPSFSNKITIALEYFEDGIVKGHSVVAGNSRPFSGVYVKKDEEYTVRVAEPGDDRYDGVFSFIWNPYYSTGLVGTWVANDTNLAVSEREFHLKKRTFEYDPNQELPEDISWASLYNTDPNLDEMEGEFLTEDVYAFNPSKDRLKKEDIENMYKGDLEIMRNSIYARHGYSFKNRKVRYIFDRYVDWYMPLVTDVRSMLTSLEKENIDLLKRYESHAEAYYDSFGR